MCSVLTHPVVPIALAPLLPQGALSPPLLLVGAACSVIPDLDVIGFKFGLGPKFTRLLTAILQANKVIMDDGVTRHPSFE